MVAKIVFSVFTICFLTSACIAQDRPIWVGTIRETLKKNEPSWIFKEYELRNLEDWYDYTFRVSKGREYISAELQWYGTLTNRDETFGGLVTIKDNTSSEVATRIKIDGLGDRAYAWKDKKTGNWSAIMFRKGKMFVRLDCFSELFGRRLAALIAESIP